MTKPRHMTYDVSVGWKNPESKPGLWFQNGKLMRWDMIDMNRNFSSHKSFQTLKKLDTFMRWMETEYKDTFVTISTPYSYIIVPMGADWKQWFIDNFDKLYPNWIEDV